MTMKTIEIQRAQILTNVIKDRVAHGASGRPHLRGRAAGAVQARQPGHVASSLTPVTAVSYAASPEVARAAVENIATAFELDPSSTYFCRPGQRVQFYRSVLSCQLDWYPRERQIVCTVPPDAAAFVYVYPRLRGLGPWAKLLRGGLAPLLCVRLDRVPAGLDASDFFDEQREAFLRAHGPFLYVSVMGVRPGRQGGGLGSALLSYVCDRADAAGLHTYIEATSERNRALYERFGFRLLQAWRGNAEMPLTYIMARPPQTVPIAGADEPEGESGAATAGVRPHAEAEAGAEVFGNLGASAPGTVASAGSGGSPVGNARGEPEPQQPTAAPGARSVGEAAAAPSATVAAAGAAPPWLAAAQQRRRRFVEVRRRQQQAQRQGQRARRYEDLDWDDPWPLAPERPSGGGAEDKGKGGAAESEFEGTASASAQRVGSSVGESQVAGAVATAAARVAGAQDDDDDDDGCSVAGASDGAALHGGSGAATTRGGGAEDVGVPIAVRTSATCAGQREEAGADAFEGAAVRAAGVAAGRLEELPEGPVLGPAPSSSPGTSTSSSSSSRSSSSSGESYPGDGAPACSSGGSVHSHGSRDTVSSGSSSVGGSTAREGSSTAWHANLSSSYGATGSAGGVSSSSSGSSSNAASSGGGGHVSSSRWGWGTDTSGSRDGDGADNDSGGGDE